MFGGEARVGVRMERTWSREPPFGQSAHSRPIGPVFLPPAPKCPAPEADHPIAKYAKSAQVSRDCVVVEVALHDGLEPFPRQRYWIVHALTKLKLDVFQLGYHALGDRFALEGELPLLGLPTDMREPQKAERLRLAFSSLIPAEFGIPSELDPARLIWMKLQPELLQPLREMFPAAVRVRLALEAQDESSRPGELHPQALTDSGLERLRSSGSYRPVAARRSNGQWANSRGSLEAVLLTQCPALCRCRLKRLYFAIAQFAKHWSR